MQRPGPILKLSCLIVFAIMAGCAGLMGSGEVDPDDDASIERAVRAEVRRAPVRGAGLVDVSVSDGVVTLTGSVPEPSAIGEIVMRAERVNGVDRVITDIVFDGSDRDSGRSR